MYFQNLIIDFLFLQLPVANSAEFREATTHMVELVDDLEPNDMELSDGEQPPSKPVMENDSENQFLDSIDEDELEIMDFVHRNETAPNVQTNAHYESIDYGSSADGKTANRFNDTDERLALMTNQPNSQHKVVERIRQTLLSKSIQNLMHDVDKRLDAMKEEPTCSIEAQHSPNTWSPTDDSFEGVSKQSRMPSLMDINPAEFGHKLSVPSHRTYQEPITSIFTTQQTKPNFCEKSSRPLLENPNVQCGSFKMDATGHSSSTSSLLGPKPPLLPFKPALLPRPTTPSFETNNQPRNLPHGDRDDRFVFKSNSLLPTPVGKSLSVFSQKSAIPFLNDPPAERGSLLGNDTFDHPRRFEREAEIPFISEQENTFHRPTLGEGLTVTNRAQTNAIPLLDDFPDVFSMAAFSSERPTPVSSPETFSPTSSSNGNSENMSISPCNANMPVSPCEEEKSPFHKEDTDLRLADPQDRREFTSGRNDFRGSPNPDWQRCNTQCSNSNRKPTIPFLNESTQDRWSRSFHSRDEQGFADREKESIPFLPDEPDKYDDYGRYGNNSSGRNAEQSYRLSKGHDFQADKDRQREVYETSTVSEDSTSHHNTDCLDQDQESSSQNRESGDEHQTNLEPPLSNTLAKLADFLVSKFGKRSETPEPNTGPQLPGLYDHFENKGSPMSHSIAETDNSRRGLYAHFEDRQSPVPCSVRESSPARRKVYEARGESVAGLSRYADSASPGYGRAEQPRYGRSERSYSRGRDEDYGYHDARRPDLYVYDDAERDELYHSYDRRPEPDYLPCESRRDYPVYHGRGRGDDYEYPSRGRNDVYLSNERRRDETYLPRDRRRNEDYFHNDRRRDPAYVRRPPNGRPSPPKVYFSGKK